MSTGIIPKPVDDQIFNCLNLNDLNSFFLFAGAGSGKTRSLVSVLTRFREKYSEKLLFSGQKVAIITYTNAACDEIIRRLDFDSVFTVSTIHSFAWNLIQPYQNEIREFLEINLVEELKKLEIEQQNSRRKTKTSEDRIRKIATKQKRLANLSNVRRFNYNPNSEIPTKDSLNHSEVIKLTAHLLSTYSLLQKILICTYPILLIDESQDTHKELIEAFLLIQKTYPKSFSLGLFGDMMQRIYPHGKAGLEQNIPDSWAKPVNYINHRCPKRVIKLINKIRLDVDNHQQIPAKTNEEGIIRFFIVNTANVSDKAEFETLVVKKMAEISGDEDWKDKKKRVKTLILEHHMAAKRGNFDKFFEPLYNIDKLKTGLLDGTLPGITLYANQILPLITALHDDDNFKVCQIIMKNSPLLAENIFNTNPNPLNIICHVDKFVNRLYSLWNNGNDPLLLDILKEIYLSGLFQIPDILEPIAARAAVPINIDPVSIELDTDRDPVIDAWDEALMSPFSQFTEYVRYISDESQFGTHQGIKGLEFPRVMVIIDDGCARGRSFYYEKLFGAEGRVVKDEKIEEMVNETSVDKTRRLFYVTCSRAKKSLAIVAYTTNPQKVKMNILSHEWFEETEILEDRDIINFN